MDDGLLPLIRTLALDARRLLVTEVEELLEGIYGLQPGTAKIAPPNSSVSSDPGDSPRGALGEGPRDIAYRHFLLWQSGRIAQDIGTLFDPDDLASRLFPRPVIAKQCG